MDVLKIVVLKLSINAIFWFQIERAIVLPFVETASKLIKNFVMTETSMKKNNVMQIVLCLPLAGFAQEVASRLQALALKHVETLYLQTAKNVTMGTQKMKTAAHLDVK